MSDRPNVLLIGNGLNRAFDGVSWDKLLENIKCRDDIDVASLHSPEPLRAIIVTNDQVDAAMKDNKSKMLGEIKTDEQLQVLRTITDMGFDHILTTNYGYEIEAAVCGKSTFSEKDAKAFMRHTDEVKRAEQTLLLHTYEEVKGRKIWHIHGEARKPDSMILGHYYYGNLLFKMKEYLKKKNDSFKKAQSEGKAVEIKSWVDAFILGDVYILGFGFGLSEFDLWWLLNRRKREKADIGGIYLYEAKPDGYNERLDLLKLLGVEIIDCGFEKKKNSDGKEELCGSYKDFYYAAISDIREKLQEAQHEQK